MKRTALKRTTPLRSKAPARRARRKARAADESAHIVRVKRMPCGCCGMVGPSRAHHIRTGQGGSQRASDFLVIPLCDFCHQGPHGIHGDRALWNIRKLTELDVLADTIRRLTQ